MKRALSLVLAAIMLMSLVACGGKNNTANDGKTNEPPKTEQKPSTSTEGVTGEATKVEVSQDAEAEYAKEITLALSLGDLDPSVGWSATRESYQRLVFDTLLWHDDVTGEIEMMLAKSVEWADDTSTRIHVVLRDDIVFSNGEKLTAEDVDYSISRATYSSVTTYYDHCEIINDYELDIVLKKPCSGFMAVLGRAACAIVCKSATEAHPDKQARIGSGPYVYDMDSYVAANKITLNRNEKFWGEQNPTEKFHLIKMADSTAAAVALHNGDVDWIVDIGEADIPGVEADEDLVLHKYNAYNFVYLAFNDKADSTTLTEEEKNFRRAVACAINKEDIAIGLGGGMVMTSMLPYDHPAYIANESDYEHDLSYNPEKAKEYLAKAGGKTEFTIVVDTGRPYVKVPAQIIQEYCRQVGITMNIEETDSTGLSALAKWGQLEYDGTMWSNLFVMETVNWNYFTPGSGVNRAMMVDPEIVAALDVLTASSDEAVKNEQYDIMLRNTHENVSWLPLVFREMYVAYTKGMEGFSLTPSPTYNYREMRLRTN